VYGSKKALPLGERTFLFPDFMQLVNLTLIRPQGVSVTLLSEAHV
jgi:hypothetical protein